MPHRVPRYIRSSEAAKKERKKGNRIDLPSRRRHPLCRQLQYRKVGWIQSIQCFDMAQFCRVAKLAVSPASMLRPTPTPAPTWLSLSFSKTPASDALGRLHLSTAPVLRSSNARREGRGPSSTTPLSSEPRNQKSYSSTNWPNRPLRPGEGDVKKPNMAVYDDDPFGPDLDFEIGELSKTRTVAGDRPTVRRTTLRTVPRTGRTVQVTSAVDVARSFKLLGSQIATNQVRQEFRKQRFHERPGLKRKRLKSERWRKRFKKGFNACVRRVKELTKQGW
ncbi:hypothetical protein GGR52DRAFT_561296 [Hypoxylon sp. FL1284]|nr:hypothetical protein GGR52DRAFT_561296 [Hypoxylon sp. FL1284]